MQAQNPLLLNSAGKVTLNSSKEIAERNLDLSAGGKSEATNHHRSIAAKVALGQHLVFDDSEMCTEHFGEHIIAVETTEDHQQVFGCNKCIFDRKL